MIVAPVVAAAVVAAVVVAPMIVAPVVAAAVVAARGLLLLLLLPWLLRQHGRVHAENIQIFRPPQKSV